MKRKGGGKKWKRNRKKWKRNGKKWKRNGKKWKEIERGESREGEGRREGVEENSTW